MVISQFRNEWLKYSKIDPDIVIPLYGSGQKRLRTFQEHSHKGVIFITNYESLSMKPLFLALRNWPEAIVFDESHKLKSPKSARSKLAFELANPYGLTKPFTYLLTGTPVLNSPMDLFQQFKILDCGETFGLNFWAFRAKYFRDRNAAVPKDRYFPKWEPMTLEKDGIDAFSQISEKIKTKSMRVTKEECLDLPEEISITVPIEMSKEQERLYQEMKKDFLTYYNGGACVATLAITKALRLLQITSGFIATKDTGEEKQVETELKDSPKRAALKELMEGILEGGHKVLVWCAFKSNYQTVREVCNELKAEYIELHGEISPSKKREQVALFQTDPNLRVLIGHPGSGGIGVDLTVAPYSIFYSRNFSLEHYLQARARNHRSGQSKTVIHYDLITTGTIDEVAHQKLVNKEDMSDSLLNAIVKEL